MARKTKANSSRSPRPEASQGLELRPTKSRVRKPIAPAALERLVDVIDLLNPMGLRDRAIVEALDSTAMRISELCELKVLKSDAPEDEGE